MILCYRKSNPVISHFSKAFLLPFHRFRIVFGMITCEVSIFERLFLTKGRVKHCFYLTFLQIEVTDVTFKIFKKKFVFARLSQPYLDLFSSFLF